VSHCCFLSGCIPALQTASSSRTIDMVIQEQILAIIVNTISSPSATCILGLLREAKPHSHYLFRKQCVFTENRPRYFWGNLYKSQDTWIWITEMLPRFYDPLGTHKPHIALTVAEVHNFNSNSDTFSNFVMRYTSSIRNTTCVVNRFSRSIYAKTTLELFFENINNFEHFVL